MMMKWQTYFFRRAFMHNCSSLLGRIRVSTPRYTPTAESVNLRVCNDSQYLQELRIVENKFAEHVRACAKDWWILHSVDAHARNCVATWHTLTHIDLPACLSDICMHARLCSRARSLEPWLLLFLTETFVSSSSLCKQASSWNRHIYINISLMLFIFYLLRCSCEMPPTPQATHIAA